MNVNRRQAWALAASLSALVAVVAGVLFAPAGAAGSSGKTYTVTTLKTRGSVWIAGGGKAMSVGRLNPGNRLVETNEIRRDDGVTGTFVATVMVASPRTVAAARAIGLMRGVYRFGDGDLYVDGTVAFAAPSATGVIVGGTGAYRGVRGTFTSSEAKDVLHLLP
jgi:hypothetical protein